jgi:hypothetical protein
MYSCALTGQKQGGKREKHKDFSSVLYEPHSGRNVQAIGQTSGTMGERVSDRLLQSRRIGSELRRGALCRSPQ